MARKPLIKHIALLLTLAYFVLSGLVTVQAGEHAAKHGHTAHHAAQHASFICSWMCAASAFVYSADPNLHQSFSLSGKYLFASIEHFLGNLSVFSFYIRPPPLSPV